eukprot:8468751-Alexandrium_andersonii.AAC.1
MTRQCLVTYLCMRRTCATGRSRVRTKRKTNCHHVTRPPEAALPGIRRPDSPWRPARVSYLSHCQLRPPRKPP